MGCCPWEPGRLNRQTRFREAHRLIEETGFVLATRGTVESADLEEGLAHGGTSTAGKSAEKRSGLSFNGVLSPVGGSAKIRTESGRIDRQIGTNRRYRCVY